MSGWSDAPPPSGIVVCYYSLVVGVRYESIALISVLLAVLFWFHCSIVGWLLVCLFLRAPPFLAGSTLELVETRHKFRGENDFSGRCSVMCSVPGYCTWIAYYRGQHSQPTPIFLLSNIRARQRGRLAPAPTRLAIRPWRK